MENGLQEAASSGRSENGNGRVTWDWVWRIASGAVLPVVLVLAGVVARIDGRIDDLDKRVALIEHNRFTSKEGAALQVMVEGKADKDDVPPGWFLRRVDTIDARLRALEDLYRDRVNR